MKKKIITALMIVALMVMNAVSSFAVQNDILVLGSYQDWCRGRSSVYNCGYYPYVIVECDAVYPELGADELKEIHVRIVDADTTPITGSSYVLITEGAGLQKVYLREGHLLDTPLFFEFRGTTNTPTCTIVSYYAR